MYVLKVQIFKEIFAYFILISKTKTHLDSKLEKLKKIALNVKLYDLTFKAKIYPGLFNA